MGPYVNLVHRLAKNQVAKSTGWRGYTLFTLQGLEHIQTDKKAFVQQSESYEHLGDVETYVMDMHARYEAMKAFLLEIFSANPDYSFLTIIKHGLFSSQICRNSSMPARNARSAHKLQLTDRKLTANYE